ncbi:uracil-DNA glycosylase family protein [Alginatibacterium sediminis]|uniref:Uracil-DNA glycosylase family protein n=1 Tax=Alginatibacterium sediminis TaxID=2164068 RepID=A0A420EHN5_9ALTE|nr:uracil-DNA glycosylase family protein [Alginatibacterium sediminis]RKF20164.1 uracil-DNA glycosylase family protein [Alginatibacterium sediminis]
MVDKKLSDLETRINNCRHCESALGFKPNPIIQLSSLAKIVIVGQAPGVKAHNSGIAFNDASGDKLRLWLGVDKVRFYESSNFALLPMGFCYPGRGKSGDLPPRAECAQIWRTELEPYVAQSGLVLLIGQYAQRYYLREKYINVTQNVKDSFVNKHKYFCLPHPSPRNNRWFRENPWFETDTVPSLKHQVNINLQ